MKQTCPFLIIKVGENNSKVAPKIEVLWTEKCSATTSLNVISYIHTIRKVTVGRFYNYFLFQIQMSNKSSSSLVIFINTETLR